MIRWIYTVGLTVPNIFMRNKLIKHLKKRDHYKDGAYFKNLYMYWTMYLLVFIVPSSVF